MPWVAVDTDIEDHPKVQSLMARRHWKVERGLVFLFRFWRTVRRHAQSGDVTGWSDAYLGRMTSTARPSGLLADLIACGLVDEADGRRTVHGWMERNGAFLKHNAEREAKAAGGRKGGATRAATAERDAAGRYSRSLEECLEESLAGSLDGVWSRQPTTLDQTHHTEHEHEHEQ
jgi:hypothetical protein